MTNYNFKNQDEMINKLPALSNDELIDLFNEEIETGSILKPISDFMYAMQKELENREIDYSEVMDEYLLLKKVKVRLEGNRLVEAS